MFIKEAFVKTYNTPPPMYTVKSPNSSEQLKKPGTAASVLPLLLSLDNSLSYNIDH